MRRGLLDRIADGEIELPMLPDVAMKILQATSDDDCDAARVSALVHSDPALASHVLKIANSPLFMPGVPIVSLRQAVARLGLSVLSEIAVTVSVSATVFSAPGFEDVLRTEKERSVRRAAWAREIARAVRTSVESAFLCGLVFRIGVPVTLQAVLEDSPDREREATLELVEALQSHVGAAVARAWRLPPAVQTVIGAEADDSLTRIVVAAGLFGSTEAEAGHPALSALNLYPDDVERLLERTDAIELFVEAMR